MSAVKPTPRPLPYEGKGRGCAAISFAFLIFTFAFAAQAAQPAQLFVVRQWDELALKDGSVLKGKVIPQDDGTFRVVNMANVGRTVPKDDVREARYRATAEMELARLANDYKGDSVMLYRVCVEGTSRFNLAPRVIPILERATASQKDPDMLLLLGKLYLQGGEAQKALNAGEQAVSAAPRRAQAYMLRGQARVAMDRVAEAEADLVKAFQAAPQDEDVALAYANFLLLTGKPDEAKKLFSEEIAKNARNFAAMSGLGMVQLRLGEFREAEMNFLQALSINAEFKPARIGLATTKLMTSQYDDAYQECVGILNLDTKCTEAFAIQGFSRMLKGDPDSLATAEQKLKDALAEKAAQPRIILAYAALLERMARYEELKGDTNAAPHRAQAAAKYAELLATDAPDSFIQFFIGERKFREAENARRNKDKGVAEINYKKAEDAFQRTVKLAPHYAPAYAAQGAAQLQLQKWEEARKAFAKAGELDANTGEYYAGQGLALLKNSARFDEASRLFIKARDLDPRNTAALCGLGYIENQGRNKSGAIEFFQQALAADGSCAYAVDALQKIYRQESMELEYVTFDKGLLPTGWKFRSPGSIKAGVADDRAVFSGVQGGIVSSKLELYKEVLKADEFVRLEADLQMDPASPVNFGLRVSSGGGALAAFELEFGKDESNEIKVRFKDFGGQPPTWSFPRKVEWPAGGKVRLGIYTDDIKTGLFTLWINGKPVANVPLKLQKPARLTVGTFLQVPAKEAVNAFVDNIVLVKRGVNIKDENEGVEGIQLIDAAPVPAPAPATGTADKGKTPQ